MAIEWVDLDFVDFIKNKLGRKTEPNDPNDPVDQAERDLAQHAEKEKSFLSKYEDARAKRIALEKSNAAAKDSADYKALQQAEQRALNLLENSRFTSAELALHWKLANWRASGKNSQVLDRIVEEARQQIDHYSTEAERAPDPQQKQWLLRHLVHCEQMLATVLDMN